MNVDSWLELKNDLMDADTGFTERMIPGEQVLLVRRGHALAGHLLHADEAQAKLRREKLAHGADALVLKVVDVVAVRLAVHVRHHLHEDRDQVLGGERAGVEGKVDARASG